MRHLPVDQRLRDHADHLAARLERRISDRRHQADRGAAVDHPDARLGEQPAESCGGLAVGGSRTGLGAAEHTQAPEHGHQPMP